MIASLFSSLFRPSPGTSTISGPVKDWVKHLADARGGMHSSSSSSSVVASSSGSVWENVKHLLYTEVSELAKSAIITIIFFWGGGKQS